MHLLARHCAKAKCTTISYLAFTGDCSMVTIYCLSSRQHVIIFSTMPDTDEVRCGPTGSDVVISHTLLTCVQRFSGRPPSTAKHVKRRRFFNFFKACYARPKLTKWAAQLDFQPSETTKQTGYTETYRAYRAGTTGTNRIGR